MFKISFILKKLKINLYLRISNSQTFRFDQLYPLISRHTRISQFLGHFIWLCLSLTENIFSDEPFYLIENSEKLKLYKILEGFMGSENKFNA